MPITSAIAGHQPAGEVLGAKGVREETIRTACSSAPAELQVSAAPAVAGRATPLGGTGQLARMLMVLRRHACAGPRDRERARASADCLLETIRVLSIL